MKRFNASPVGLASLALVATIGCTMKKADSADTAAAAMDTAALTTTTAPPAGASTSPATAPTAGGAPAAPTSGATASGGMIDPNSATRADLAAIPGMTDAVINAVIAARPYNNMVAFDKALAASLNEKQRDSVYARIWRPIDLNTATGEEILLIPGVGPRMRHEFEEYRPYKSMDQFRREIGKYVDKNEVARLERYVTIR
jgi:DNA uptake protein ComE-like DNA-binding protein